MAVNESININAPADKIFAVYADVENWSNWDKEVISSTLDGPFEVDTTGEIVPKGEPRSPIKLTEVTRNKSFTVECKLPLCKMHFIHELEQFDDYTTVINKAEFSGLLAPIFSRLIGPKLKDGIASSLANLKQHVEVAISSS